MCVRVCSEEVEECQIDDECFAIPAGYRRLQGSGRGTVDQEEELLQMAIQQSLLEQSPTAGEGEGEEVGKLTNIQTRITLLSLSSETESAGSDDG